MANYTLPNVKAGGVIQVQGNSLAEAQQNAATQTGVSLSAQQGGGTFGSQSLVSGGDNPATPTAPASTTDTNLDALRTYFAQTSGFSIKELEEKKREFDLTRTETQRQFDTTQAESARQFNATFGLNQSKLGLDYLTTAAGMGGPASVFQQADFLRGAQQRGDVPGFLNALASNTQMPAFNGAGNATMVPQTPGGLALQLGAGQTATIPTTGAVAPAANARLTPEQLAQIEVQMAQQIGNKDWASNRFRAAYASGASIQDAITAGADTARTWNMPNIPQPVAAAAPMAPPATAAAPVATVGAGLGTDPAGYSYDQALSQIGNIFKAGPTSLAPGSLERLDPNELAILSSGAKKLGYDDAAWLRAYQRGGIGQASSAAM